MGTKNNLIKQSMRLLGDNPHHTFFAVTIRIHERFHRRFSPHQRMPVTEQILQNIILKYEAHLISNPNKPKNQHLKIISHNAIETKSRFGSPEFPHSHGLWGIHEELLQKWNTEDLHNEIFKLGSFKYESQTYPLRKVIQSIHREGFTSNLIEKTTPEGWLDYAYKWADDDDPLRDWSFVQSPTYQNQITKKEIWNEPYPTHQSIFTRLRKSQSRSEVASRLVV